MKRLFSLLFATLAVATGFLRPISVNAQAIGTSCCPANYEYRYGSCVNTKFIDTCKGLTANSSSGLCNLKDPILGNSICTGGAGLAIQTACTSFGADLPDVNQLATAVCNEAWKGIVKIVCPARIIDPNALCASETLADWSGITQAFLTQCTSLAIPAFTNALGGNAVVVATNCNTGLVCNQTGKCAKGLPPAIASGANCVNTALGCFDFTGKSTVQVILNWSIGIAGGIAFVMILAASLQITTARGDAKRVQAGKELLFSALAGIFMIVLAIVLLNFLGLNVLGLQQFGFV